MGARLALAFALLALAGCARTPAECAVPDVVPSPPPAHATRALATSLALDADGACHVRVRLSDELDAHAWPAARDAALASAALAAAACCPAPRAVNADAWPAGARAFDLAFACASRAP